MVPRGFNIGTFFIPFTLLRLEISLTNKEKVNPDNILEYAQMVADLWNSYADHTFPEGMSQTQYDQIFCAFISSIYAEKVHAEELSHISPQEAQTACIGLMEKAGILSFEDIKRYIAEQN